MKNYLNKNSKIFFFWKTIQRHRTNKMIAQRDQLSAREHLEKITHKGPLVYCEQGFRVFSGYDNIFLGSNIYLVDSLINAGDNLGRVTIDDYVLFGHGVKLLARGHDYRVFNDERHRSITEKPIHIKEGAWIGSGAIILGGITIGEHSVVGAGSVITRDVPAYTVVAGNPAQIIKSIPNEK